ncbi:hypothetical protein CIRG_02228 [Coccidioides immitis RMSCC 2394]|uniref:Uncharacterized protein n=1 Tax=Coccidioides immitis RMSCC 2394 TaxID=404692 RepID=A0A0J6Y4Z8_COCIT|nr:hypothetical protein CIRG_02228 [Coccidioides immitis RMSCC 2394]
MSIFPLAHEAKEEGMCIRHPGTTLRPHTGISKVFQPVKDGDNTSSINIVFQWPHTDSSKLAQIPKHCTLFTIASSLFNNMVHVREQLASENITQTTFGFIELFWGFIGKVP